VVENDYNKGTVKAKRQMGRSEQATFNCIATSASDEADEKALKNGTQMDQRGPARSGITCSRLVIMLGQC
jgi:hypothetical protein